jgi:hypothetical protein
MEHMGRILFRFFLLDTRIYTLMRIDVSMTPPSPPPPHPHFSSSYLAFLLGTVAKNPHNLDVTTSKVFIRIPQICREKP